MDAILYRYMYFRIYRKASYLTLCGSSNRLEMEIIVHMNTVSQNAPVSILLVTRLVQDDCMIVNVTMHDRYSIVCRNHDV